MFSFCSTDSFCLVGSHSHRFFCVRISDGAVMWETRLGGRIEATSALSAIHKLIVVGKFIKKSELVTWRVISFFCCIFAICIYSTVWICWSTLSMMPPCIFELDIHTCSAGQSLTELFLTILSGWLGLSSSAVNHVPLHTVRLQIICEMVCFWLLVPLVAWWREHGLCNWKNLAMDGQTVQCVLSC